MAYRVIPKAVENRAKLKGHRRYTRFSSSELRYAVQEAELLHAEHGLMFVVLDETYQVVYESKGEPD